MLFRFKKIFGWTIYIVVFGLIFLLWERFQEKEIEKSQKNYSIEYELREGVVIDKNIHTEWGNRGGLTLNIEGAHSVICNKRIFDIIKIGDTVKKEKGSNLFFINGKPFQFD